LVPQAGLLFVGLPVGKFPAIKLPVPMVKPARGVTANR